MASKFIEKGRPTEDPMLALVRDIRKHGNGRKSAADKGAKLVKLASVVERSGMGTRALALSAMLRGKAVPLLVNDNGGMKKAEEQRALMYVLLMRVGNNDPNMVPGFGRVPGQKLKTYFNAILPILDLDEEHQQLLEQIPTGR